MSAVLVVPYAHALVLVDSAKRVIGEVVEPDFAEPGYVWVGMQSGDATALVLFGRDSYTTYNMIEYTAPNCTGDAGIRVTSGATEGEVLWQAAIAPPGATLYMTKKSPKTPPRELVVNSGWDPDSFECINYDEPATGLFAHTFVVGPMTLYKPPFLIKTPRMK
jgi:hypothetical protein